MNRKYDFIHTIDFEDIKRMIDGINFEINKFSVRNGYQDIDIDYVKKNTKRVKDLLDLIIRELDE